MKATLRRGALAGATVALLAATTATAATPQPPMRLPGAVTAASAGGRWLVGARPSAAARALAARFGAHSVGPAGTGGYAIATGRARAFAAALRRHGLLVYAEPNTDRATFGVPDDPLSGDPDAWRRVVARRSLTPPVPTPSSPLIALLDTQLDATHPEFAGSNITTIERYRVRSEHGTATASVAAAPVNGRGIVGVWPGARALNIPFPHAKTITCDESANAIAEAVRRGAAVINMSYGSPGYCYTEYVAMQFAVAQGVVPVAAAGNEGANRNPMEFPGSLPHVLTIAAVAPGGKPVGFSNTNAAIDLAAPGVSIMAAVPPAFDEEDPVDGYMHLSGTSFSTPMVSAAVAWLRQARPQFTAGQVAQAIRLSARDVGPSGWDPNTGFGVLSVGRALQMAHPPEDTAEPNDDVIWVDGRAFGTPAPLMYDGTGHAHRHGLLDVYEDPADVYRIRVNGHRRAVITAKPGGRHDDVALRVYRRKATTIFSPAYRRSLHHGHRKERIVLRNAGRRPKTFYVSVRVQGSNLLDAAYALRVG